MQFAVCKLDHFWVSYNILKFLKLCAETACGRKFVRLPDPTLHVKAQHVYSNIHVCMMCYFEHCLQIDVDTSILACQCMLTTSFKSLHNLHQGSYSCGIRVQDLQESRNEIYITYWCNLVTKNNYFIISLDECSTCN